MGCFETTWRTDWLARGGGGGDLGAWSMIGVQMGGAEEAQNAEEAQSWIAVLCVILLTCVKF